MAVLRISVNPIETLKLMPEGVVLVRKEWLKSSGHVQILKTSDQRLHFWQFEHLAQLFSKIRLQEGVHYWIYC